MHLTRHLLFKGFVGRSVDELKRLTTIIVNQENIRGAQTPLIIHSFHSAPSTQDCLLTSDEVVGGFSSADLTHVATTSPAPPGCAEPPQPRGFARFHGHISTKLPEHNIRIERSGFAAFRTKDRPFNLFGTGVWDVDPFVYLALRVRLPPLPPLDRSAISPFQPLCSPEAHPIPEATLLCPPRSFLINVQTESIVPTDLHQHRLFPKRPGQWETIFVKWSDFVRTNHGYVVEPQTGMMRRKVRNVGIALTDRVEGPFAIDVERIWATNKTAEDNGEMGVEELGEMGVEELGEVAAAARKDGDGEDGGKRESALRDKTGKGICWRT